MSPLIVQYFLNHRLDPDEVERQVREFARQGYQGLYAHARAGLLTPYFSAAWWEIFDRLLAVCRETGLELYIWDDDYFPSGLCGGRVVWSDPGLAARELKFTLRQVSGAGPFEVDFAPGMLVGAYAVRTTGQDEGPAEVLDLAACCGTRHTTWGPRYVLHRAYSPGINPVGHPHWRTSCGGNHFAVVWSPEEPGDYTIVGATAAVSSATHPDLLRPEGIARFLELTHEEYRRRYPEELGRTIKGAFTDEPSPGAMLLPWSPGLPAQFAADHGYSLLDHLPHLALDLDDRSPLVRHHYRLTQHRLQKANYVDQVSGWCREHGIAHVGHLTRTEWLSLTAAWWPNELRCYSSMDVPCADPLGASCGFPDAAAYHTGLKVVSSAAHLFGKQRAGADCLAVIGDEASLRDLKYLFDYHLVLGINHFTIHGASYSLDGPRKDEVPPSLSYQHSEWKHFPVLLEHVRATAEAFVEGRHVCSVAVLYPSTSLYCQAVPHTEWTDLPEERLYHALVEELLCRQKDFDLIDEVTLAERVDEAGVLRTPERHSVIVLPYLRYLDVAAATALQRFSRAGGRVICVGQVPLALTGDLQAPLGEWAEEVAEFQEGPEEEWLASLPGPAVEGDGARDVFVLQYSRMGRQLCFAFNRAERTFSGTIDGMAAEIAPRSSLCFEDGTAMDGLVPPLPDTQPQDLSGGWEVTFEDNQLPLSFWHCEPPGGFGGGAFTAGEPFDLMRREAAPEAAGEGPVSYYCRFMLCGEVPDARLVIEDSTIGGDWRLFVNDQPVSGWERCRDFDCLNLHAAIGPLLRGDSTSGSAGTPQLNVIRIDTSGTGRGLHEIPYLRGSFTCQCRYGHLSYPFVQGAPARREVASLQPWDVLGYPTFSGSAVYRRQVEVPAAGDYLLDLGRVEDVAALTVDAKAPWPTATLAWEPYRLVLKDLKAGEHVLEIEVCNAPANRTRAAGLPAGLLGPVRLYRQG